MITFLEGKIEAKEPTRVVLNVGGVGYELFVPLSTSDKMPAAGETCRLLTFDYPREDQHLLYGFAEERERDAFLMLLAVNGIGAKLALAALSRINVADLCHAIAQGDTRRLASISGIGKRLAERMVVELKDRAVMVGGERTSASREGHPAGVGADSRAADAVAALVALGYRIPEAERSVAAVMGTVDGNANVEEIIRKALTG